MKHPPVILQSRKERPCWACGQSLASIKVDPGQYVVHCARCDIVVGHFDGDDIVLGEAG